MKRLSLLVAAAFAVGCAGGGETKESSDFVVSKAGKSKTFEAKHELKVTVSWRKSAARTWVIMSSRASLWSKRKSDSVCGQTATPPQIQLPDKLPHLPDSGRQSP